MVSIGRGHMAQPRLLVIDEPWLGPSPLYAKEHLRIISQISLRLGITVLRAGQKLRRAQAMADRGCVLAPGPLVAQGAAQALADDAEVRAGYFG